MSHDYHEELPGYSAAQVLHDGCGECEYRAQSDDHGLSSLDAESFQRAWARATEWNKRGLADIADVERPMFAALWGVQVQFERRGTPIGTLPFSFTAFA